jgi:hypothetical protein
MLGETVAVAVMEVVRLLTDRGLIKGKPEELTAIVGKALEEDRRTTETIIRGELASHRHSLREEFKLDLAVQRAELDARLERMEGLLRRASRREALRLAALIVLLFALGLALWRLWGKG